ncbi:MAG: hypothetical protein IKP28_04880 [Clostridia bacterium]|nr:hypothetical protein [Clostridia bacterium]
MIAKIWQKLGLIILIIACLFNIVVKIVNKITLQQEMDSAVEYVKTLEEEKKKN